MLIIIMLFIAATFVTMAAMNRGKTADAAHVFLVAGFAGCCSVLIFASIAHANDVRTFDRDVIEHHDCLERVERSQGANAFNRLLVEILDERLPDDPDVERLRRALVEALSADDCGPEPVDEPRFVDSLF